jgi:hypothetical protein
MQKTKTNRIAFSRGARRASRSADERDDSNPALQNPDRRSFFWGLASLALARGAKNPEKNVETIFRFLTPECEVRMSVQHFENSSGKDFRFRDRLTNRAFCLEASGEEDGSCSLRFAGSMAIAIYHFFPRFVGFAPAKLRERVMMIDHDSRMTPRPPFERNLSIERDMASDIQAFGYDAGDPTQAMENAKTRNVWSLLHQDLYLNDESSPFLIVHWKHTLDQISLVDVIPGEQTVLMNP